MLQASGSGVVLAALGFRNENVSSSRPSVCSAVQYTVIPCLLGHSVYIEGDVANVTSLTHIEVL